VGRVGPGELLQLPLGWQRAGWQLQVKPLIDPSCPPCHDWSVGTSEGAHTIKLEALDESVVRLVTCPPLPQEQQEGAEVSPDAAHLSAMSLWFSLTVESELLTGGKGSEPLTDWRVVVAPPLVIANHLPLPGSILVWEEQRVRMGAF
jgi:vacuolar protein sorting-associated protein 13A/C